jgi:hypothetical protein
VIETSEVTTSTCTAAAGKIWSWLPSGVTMKENSPI